MTGFPLKSSSVTFFSMAGGLVLLVALGHVLFLPGQTWLGHKLWYLLIAGGSGVGLLYGGEWHRRKSISESQYPRILAWVGAGSALLIATGLVSLYIGSVVVTPREIGEVIQLSASVGLLIGFSIGSWEALAIENTETATRAVILEKERQQLKEVNDLLRHYVLNGLMVIDGHVEILSDSVDESDRDSLRTVDERTSLMTKVLNNTGVLLKTNWESVEVHEGNVVSAIHTECERQAPAQASITCPADSPRMYANVGYEKAAALLVDGIVQLVDENGSVEISVAESDGRLSVSCQPAQIPENLRDSLFEPVAAEIGLELYLAHAIFKPAIVLELVTAEDDRVEFALNGDFLD